MALNPLAVLGSLRPQESFTVWYCRRVYTHLSLAVFITDRMLRCSYSRTAFSENTQTHILTKRARAHSHPTLRNIMKPTFFTQVRSSEVLSALEKQNRSTSQHTL